MEVQWPFRVTNPLLDVIELLLDASGELHGWEIMRRTGRSGATVYQTLERLRNANWIDWRWENENPDPGKPRRRLYWLKPNAIALANELLAVRRPRQPHATGRDRLIFPRPPHPIGGEVG